MSPRTTPSQWAALFNFAGGGLVHMELFEALLMTATNPSLFEAIAAYLLLYGTHSLRPAAGDTPLNCIYFETDTTELFQNQAATWVQINTAGSGGNPANVPGCRVANSGDQTLSNATGTKLTFDTELYDPQTMHDNTTNNTRITIAVAGTYLLTATVTFAANATGERYVDFIVNNTTYIANHQATPGPTSPTGICIATLYKLDAGDYVEVEAYQSSGFGLAVSHAAEWSAQFAAQLLTT